MLFLRQEGAGYRYVWFCGLCDADLTLGGDAEMMSRMRIATRYALLQRDVGAVVRMGMAVGYRWGSGRRGGENGDGARGAVVGRREELGDPKSQKLKFLFW